MVVSKEITDFYNLNTWSGGHDRWQEILDNGHGDEAMEYLEMIFGESGEAVDETTINDYLWFDAENDHPEWFNKEESDDEESDEEVEVSDEEYNDIVSSAEAEAEPEV